MEVLDLFSQLCAVTAEGDHISSLHTRLSLGPLLAYLSLSQSDSSLSHSWNVL